MSRILKATCFKPAVRLLAHRFWRRKIMGEVIPLRSSTGHPKESVKHFPNGVFPLSCVLRAEKEVG